MGTLLTKQGLLSSAKIALVILFCFAQFQPNTCAVLKSPFDHTGRGANPEFFTAAVYEHRAVIPVGPDKPNWDYAKSVIASNLDIYEEQMRIAAQQGVDIIVFPEDGLIGLSFNRDDIYNYLEHMPDPTLAPINPCDDYEDQESRPIQVRMSCAARKHNMYVVINTGDIQNCTIEQDPDCPADGRYQFNTNVVFDSEGNLIARYHKQNLFYEFQFDIPPAVQHIAFDTPFGRMGMFICFDILFKEPAIDLVEEYGIQHALFPTAWRSIIPSMSGLGFHESWAIRMGVNLLSSEYHLPELDWIGCAVYRAALGAKEFYNNYTVMSPGKLLITQTPVNPVAPIQGFVDVPFIEHNLKNFTSVMESNLYTWLPLVDTEGELYLKDQDTECYLKYRMSSKASDDLYAFGIFEGQHYDYLNSYIQVCAVVRCEGLTNSSCGIPTRDAHSVFDVLHLSGGFSVDYIFPGLLVDDGDIDKASWDFLLDKENNRGQMTASDMSHPLLSAILYTRDYSRDNNSDFERPLREPMAESLEEQYKNSQVTNIKYKEYISLLESNQQFGHKVDLYKEDNKEAHQFNALTAVLSVLCLVTICIGLVFVKMYTRKTA